MKAILIVVLATITLFNFTILYIISIFFDEVIILNQYENQCL